MPDLLAPAPTREAVVLRPGDLLTRPWQRWLEDLWRQLGTAEADLGALQTQVDALAADLDALEALVAALVQPQTTTLTVAVSGAAVLTFPAMAPAGATVRGVTWSVSTTFTGALTGLLVGDSVVGDRWGQASAVSAGTTGGSAAWRGPGGFTVPSAYTVLAQAVGDTFGAAGALTCACTWWPALLPPP